MHPVYSIHLSSAYGGSSSSEEDDIPNVQAMIMGKPTFRLFNDEKVCFTYEKAIRNIDKIAADRFLSMAVDGFLSMPDEQLQKRIKTFILNGSEEGFLPGSDLIYAYNHVIQDIKTEIPTLSDLTFLFGHIKDDFSSLRAIPREIIQYIFQIKYAAYLSFDSFNSLWKSNYSKNISSISFEKNKLPQLQIKQLPQLPINVAEDAGCCTLL